MDSPSIADSVALAKRAKNMLAGMAKGCRKYNNGHYTGEVNGKSRQHL